MSTERFFERVVSAVARGDMKKYTQVWSDTEGFTLEQIALLLYPQERKRAAHAAKIWATICSALLYVSLVLLFYLAASEYFGIRFYWTLLFGVLLAPFVFTTQEPAEAIRTDTVCGRFMKILYRHLMQGDIPANYADKLHEFVEDVAAVCKVLNVSFDELLQMDVNVAFKKAAFTLEKTADAIAALEDMAAHAHEKAIMPSGTFIDRAKELHREMSSDYDNFTSLGLWKGSFGTFFSRTQHLAVA
ncbi:MAG: hypothetical protein AAB472_01145 [Patescibacteria group bacterium]